MAESTRDILIQTMQPEAAREFYERVLGLTVFQEDPQMYGLEGGALRLYIDRGPALGPVLEFLVDDVQQAKAQMVAAGCSVIEENPAIPRCYVRDPFGLVFNLGRKR